jgi:hypothetical protein
MVIAAVIIVAAVVVITTYRSRIASGAVVEPDAIALEGAERLLPNYTDAERQAAK